MEQNIESFKKHLEDFGIYSRVAKVSIWANIIESTKTNIKELEERFNTLALSNTSDLKSHINTLKSKNLTQDSDELVLDILVEIYNKLNVIEKKLDDKKQNLTNSIAQEIDIIAYEILHFKESLLHKDSMYFVSFILPVFPGREIGIFCKALDCNIAKITKIQKKDSEDFDTLIVQKEREMIQFDKQNKGS